MQPTAHLEWKALEEGAQRLHLFLELFLHLFLQSVPAEKVCGGLTQEKGPSCFACGDGAWEYEFILACGVMKCIQSLSPYLALWS